MLNIQDLVIDAQATVGSKLLLVDVAPAYVYADGKRTGEISGYKYVVALPERQLEKLSVKIDGVAQMAKPEDDYPVVEFDGLEMSLYWTPNGYQVSAKATGISLTEE